MLTTFYHMETQIDNTDLRSLDINQLNEVIKAARKQTKAHTGKSVQQELWPDATLRDKLVNRKGGLARAVFELLHKDCISSISDLAIILEKDIISEMVEHNCFVSNLILDTRLEDPDGTIKYRFKTADGHCFESVMMFLRNRTTACVSSQIGCRMGCAFCATAQLKFIRNLTAGEIASQVSHLSKEHGKIDNVVYMGMGEPLDNYNEVMASVRILTHYAGLCIPPGRITVSTAGLPDQIRQMADDNIPANLALSLHSADDKIRSNLMALSNKHPISKVMSATRYFSERSNKRILIEYCMIKDINDSNSDCDKLLRLLNDSKMQVSVNLIEFNSHPLAEMSPSPRKRIDYFCDQLMQAGIETTIRFKRGESINAACGQLCNE